MYLDFYLRAEFNTKAATLRELSKKRVKQLAWKLYTNQITNIQFSWLKLVPKEFSLILTKTINMVITSNQGKKLLSSPEKEISNHRN